MKARKLVKDSYSGKQNIVFFGSYGYYSEMTFFDMYLTKQEQSNPLYIAEDLFISDNLFIRGYNTTYYNYSYSNLYFKKEQEEQFITITTTYQQTFNWLIQFNAFDKNENKNILIQKLGIGREECKISIDELIDEFGNYDMISNFSIAIIIESASPILDMFTIEYPMRKAKLAYDKEKYTPKNPYTYLESQQFNYSTGVKGVRDALIPRLSVIKGELWYKMSYGLPLMEKIKSKGIYDSIIVRYITDYSDVVNLEDFYSSLDNYKYVFNCNINTIYGEKINLSNE